MLQKYRLMVASLIYLVCCLLLYPAYRFIFDDDGIGYMMVTRRMAEGDWHNAINGYWSPLHSWLAFPLVKAGLTEITAFRITNWILGYLMLVWIFRLSNRTSLTGGLKTALLLVSIPVTIHFAIYEVAADVLFCWLVLVYVDLITRENFFQSLRLNLLCGVLGALLYFSKTYAFPFFLLHFALMQFWFFRQSAATEKKRWITRNLAAGIGIFLLMSGPWIAILYQKYHILTIGYSGKINQDVHLYSRQLTTDALMTPPPYPDAPSTWEDPISIPMERTPGEYFFRPDILVKQARLFLTNVIRGVDAFNRLSFLSLAILFGMGIFLQQQRDRVPGIFFFTALLLPLGYLLVFIESRYIWPVGLLLLIGGACLLQSILSRMRIRGKWAIACWAIFFGSFLLRPLDQLKDAVNGNRELFQLADFAREKHITGKYVTADNADYSMVPKLAFLTRSSTWSLLRSGVSWEETLQAMRSNGIGYYFFRYNNAREMQSFMEGALYKAAYKVHDAGIWNLVILEIK